MTIYKVREFNKRRLQRGEIYCFKTDVFEDEKPSGWVWLSSLDIREIINDCECDISGHTEYSNIWSN